MGTGNQREHRRAESVSTYPKAPRSPHTSPTTGAIAEELNERPRAALGWLTPREAYERLLVASTT